MPSSRSWYSCTRSSTTCMASCSSLCSVLQPLLRLSSRTTVCRSLSPIFSETRRNFSTTVGGGHLSAAQRQLLVQKACRLRFRERPAGAVQRRCGVAELQPLVVAPKPPNAPSDGSTMIPPPNRGQRGGRTQQFNPPPAVQRPLKLNRRQSFASTAEGKSARWIRRWRQYRRSSIRRQSYCQHCRWSIRLRIRRGGASTAEVNPLRIRRGGASTAEVQSAASRIASTAKVNPPGGFVVVASAPPSSIRLVDSSWRR